MSWFPSPFYKPSPSFSAKPMVSILDNEKDHKPHTVKQASAQRNISSMFPFTMEDDCNDENRSDSRPASSLHLQPDRLSKIAQKRAAERLRSQRLREQAMQRKSNPSPRSILETPSRTFNVIDLCSPEPSSPTKPAKHIFEGAVEATKTNKLGGYLQLANPPSRTSNDVEGQQRREERVFKMRERNKRNREHTSEEDADEADAESPAAQASASVQPVALTSVNLSSKKPKNCDHQTVEVRKPIESSAIDPPTHPIPATDPSTHPTTAGRQKRERQRVHQRQLGEIQQIDLRLVEWRKAGVSWTDVLRLHEEASGKKRVTKTLQKRHNQVADALRKVKIDDSLTQRGIAGDVQSIRQINNLVRHVMGNGDEKEDDALHVSLDSRPSRKKLKRTHTSGTETKDVDTSELEQALHQAFSEEVEEIPARANVGGKSINWSTWLSMNRGAYEDSDTDARFKSPEETDGVVNEEDYCHFIYQVERRECTIEMVEEGYEMDGVAWIKCSDYETLFEANMAAAAQVFLSTPGKPQFADPEGHFVLTQNSDEDGTKMFTLENQRLGTVETRVVRGLRLHYEQVLPKPDGMIGRVGYNVNWKITRKVMGDDLFGEGTEQVEHGSLDTTFTLADIANKQAIGHYVELAFKSPLANLDQRKEKKQQMANDVLGKLQDSGQDLFREASGEGTDKMVEVWVQKVRITGPRNLY